jgi:hypothetical membrane protein
VRWDVSIIHFLIAFTNMTALSSITMTSKITVITVSTFTAPITVTTMVTVTAVAVTPHSEKGLVKILAMPQ